MSLIRRFLLFLRNPLVIIPPVVLLLAIGWQQYTYAGRNLSFPESSNLLPDGVFTDFDSDGVPKGWQITSSGQLNYETDSANGYASGQALKITVGNYENGDLSLSSPKVYLKPGMNYLFKGYYTSSVPFSLSMREYGPSGSSMLTQVGSYQAESKQWTTASDAFKTTSSTTAVQFVFRAYNSGTLKLNSFYLEPENHVYIDPGPSGNNLVPNSQLTLGYDNTPVDWSTYHAGFNTSAFSYLQNASGPYLQVKVTSYSSGEDKWQYPPKSVQPGQYYQFSVRYMSDTTVPIVAECMLQNGTRSYQTVAQLTPADDWTDVTSFFETPAGATNMFVSLPLQHNGTVSSQDYQLINITKQPAASWPGPAISLTFDSGRQSQYVNAVPLLKQYGYNGTFYINPSTIDTSGFMTADELTDLGESGDEIGARGYNPYDMTAINDSTLHAQLLEGRDYLRSAGFEVTDFAAPYGRSDAEVQYYARQYFNTLRGTDTGINTWQNLDPYDLKVLNISSATSTQTLRSELRTVKSEKGWLILVYQGVGDTSVPLLSSSTEQQNISPASFKKQLEIIKKSGVKEAPVGAIYRSIRQ